VQNFESDCNKINDSIKDSKSLTDGSTNSLSSVVNQNTEDVENKVRKLTQEFRSFASGLENCNCNIKIDKQNYQLEIQRLESQIENLRARINGNLAMHKKSTVCAS